MALTEIKLSGKLDLSLWRGLGDLDEEEDKDSSSIDLSPLPIVTSTSPSNNNWINGNVANLGLTTPHQTPVPQSADGYSGSGTGAAPDISNTTGSANFLHATTFSRSESSSLSSEKLEWDDRATTNLILQLHPVESHNNQSQAQHFGNSKRDDNFVETNLDGRSTTTTIKEQSKGGVKKVEFVAETEKSNSMDSGVNPGASSLGSKDKDKNLKGE